MQPERLLHREEFFGCDPFCAPWWMIGGVFLGLVAVMVWAWWWLDPR